MENNNLFLVSSQKSFKTTSFSKIPVEKSVNFSITQAIKFYFDTCYFYCVIPFRLKWDSNTNTYLIISYLPQKILCIITNLITYIWYLLLLRHIYPKNTKSSNQTFIFFEAFFYACFHLNLSIVFWFYQSNVASLINYVAHTDFQLATARVQKLFFHLHTQVSLLIIQFSLAVLAFVTQFDIDNWTTKMLFQGQLSLFLNTTNDSPDKSQTYDTKQRWPTSEHFVFVFSCTANFFQK